MRVPACEPVRAAQLDVRELSVEPLDSSETRTLANTLLGEAALAPGREALVDAIARESAGNPFFVAELVRYVAIRRRGCGGRIGQVRLLSGSIQRL